MIIDMHCDTISELMDQKKKGSLESLRRNCLCLDLERMKANSYILQNFAVFVHLGRAKDPFANAMEQVRFFQQELEQNQDICSQVFSYEDIEKNLENGKLSAMLTLEEGGMCCGELEKLQALYQAGARMMALCWNYENELGYPATPEKEDTSSENRGLKETGIQFLEEMEHLGMIPDVSHMSDEGVRDVLAHTRKPFVASHSNARAVWNHGRNLPDDLLRSMGERGCVIGLNYYQEFLNGGNSEEKASDVLAKHALWIVNKAGMESIGLGSDFDGFTPVSDMADPAGTEHLIWALHRVGFSDGEIEKICSENVLRLYKEVL